MDRPIKRTSSGLAPKALSGNESYDNKGKVILKTISQKLGIWPDDRILVVNAEDKVLNRIKEEVKGEAEFVAECQPDEKFPMVLIWLREGDDATAIANKYKQMIDQIGQLWFFFPKREMMRRDRLTNTRETITLDVMRARLETTKICSIDAETQALGFVLPLRD